MSESSTGADQKAGADGRGPQIDVRFGPCADGSGYETWRGHTAWFGQADLLDPAHAPHFHGRIRIYPFADLVYSDVSLSHPQHLARSPRDVALTGLTHLQIHYHAAGHYDGVCGERPYHPREGGISFIDLGQPYAFTVPALHTRSLMVPRSMLPASMLARRLHGYVPPHEAPATRLMARFMDDFAEIAATLSRDEMVSALHAIIRLADAVSTGCGLREGDAPQKADPGLFDRIRSFVENNLGKETLDTEAVASAAGVSRKKLYDLFAGYGGVGAYIRERRLQTAYDVINTDLRNDETLGAIGYSLGFGSEAVFSRSFTQRFGLRPSDLRRLARGRGVDVLLSRTPELPPRAITALGGPTTG